MHKMISIAALGLVAAACSPETPAPAAPTPSAEAAAPAAAMADMPMAAEAPAAAGPITSMGKIVAINAEAGAVTLEHQAIPEVKWDAMSMGFTTTDPAILKDLKVGDMVVFDLVSAAEPTKISRIVKQ